MNYRSRNSGIMPSTSSQDPSHSVQRFTPYPLSNRKNSMTSSTKTYQAATSIPQNRRWHPQSSSSKKRTGNYGSSRITKSLQRFALCKACVNFESETKLPPREHDFSSISRWIALKIEIRTYLKISEVLPYSFSHEILSKKIVSDRVALNSRTQFRDNGGLLAFDM